MRKIRGILDAKCVKSQIIGTQSDNFIDGFGKTAESFAGQTGNKIRIDMLDFRFSRHFKSAKKILRGMLPSDKFQHVVVERLGIDADSRYTVGLYDV